MKNYYSILIWVLFLILLCTIWFVVGGLWGRTKCPTCPNKTPVEMVLESRCPTCPTIADCPTCIAEYITEPCPLEPDPFTDIIADELAECNVMIEQLEQVIETQKGVIEVQNKLLEMR